MEPFPRAVVIIACDHVAIGYFVAIAVPWLIAVLF
jgi:hypothetical protein